MSYEAALRFQAWSVRDEVAEVNAVAWPEHVTREWAWGGSRGAGVRVCVVDSGVDGEHPLVKPLESAVAVSIDEQGEARIVEGEVGDLAGHGTACASIIRSLAPECRLFSARVLGAGAIGTGQAFVAGVRWAVEQRFEVINMSLSTTVRELEAILHDLADNAYFRQSILVCSAHNMPVESYPWHFSSVISVASHAKADPLTFFYNPSPPVEFFARGIDVEAASTGGGVLRLRATASPRLTSRRSAR